MSYLLAPGGDSVYVPSLRRPVAPLDDVRAIAHVLRVLRRVQPALVHTHMAKAGAVGRAAVALYNRLAPRRARTVHTYHGHVLEGYFSPVKTGVFLNVERLLARATDRLIAISPEVLHDLLETYRIGNPGQYSVVPLGFDLSPFASIQDADRQAARAALGVPSDAPVVTTVGRLTAIKQHDLLLRAARHVVDRSPNATFLIAGDGELRVQLEQQAEQLRLADRVRFLGWRRDLARIYAATDVFALTSRNEGTPVALIEAMASGVPGVSTAVGGVRHVIASNEVGRLVLTHDPAAFGEAVLDLLSAPDRALVSSRARAVVLQRFTIERLVTDVAALYRTLLNPAV